MIKYLWCEECQGFTTCVVTDYGPLHFDNCYDCGTAYTIDALVDQDDFVEMESLMLGEY